MLRIANNTLSYEYKHLITKTKNPNITVDSMVMTDMMFTDSIQYIDICTMSLCLLLHCHAPVCAHVTAW